MHLQFFLWGFKRVHTIRAFTYIRKWQVLVISNIQSVGSSFLSILVQEKIPKRTKKDAKKMKEGERRKGMESTSSHFVFFTFPRPMKKNKNGTEMDKKG